MPVLHDDVKAVLVAAGWRDDQDRSSLLQSWTEQLTPEFALFPAAEQALLRYGGVEVHQRGPGLEQGRDHFDFIPTHAIGEADRFQAHEEKIGAILFPIGEISHGHAFLAIAPDGRVFALMQDLWFVGDTVESAIEALVRGTRLAPLGRAR